MLLEKKLEGAKAAVDVLGRIGLIDAYDQELGPRLDDTALVLLNPRVFDQRRQLVGVDRDASRTQTGRGAGVGDGGFARNALGPDNGLRRLDEVAAPASGVEADHVVRQQPVVD